MPDIRLLDIPAISVGGFSGTNFWQTESLVFIKFKVIFCKGCTRYPVTDILVLFWPILDGFCCMYRVLLGYPESLIPLQQMLGVYYMWLLCLHAECIIQ